MTAPRSWLLPFAVFAFTYFLAALLRAVTATLAPAFSAEFALTAADLGLLAGAYFLGFSLLQLPMGAALDHWGPRRVEATLVVLAVAGCAVFAASSGFAQLVVGRVLIGMGASACLMAPLTFFRHHLEPSLQLRCNSWMLMTGSLGMVASTVPVQWLQPLWGWRGLFWALAGLLAIGLAGLLAGLPKDRVAPAAGRTAAARYRDIVGHPEFIRVAPLAVVNYGGLIAMQALWAGPWLTQVCGWTPAEASQGLLLINAGMLFAFLSWGLVMPAITRRGIAVATLITWGLVPGHVLLAGNAWLGPSATAVHWMAWCVTTSVVTLAQPALANAFAVRMAGRALSAFNLLVFVGVFAIQWGMGAAIDGLRGLGYSTIDAFRGTAAAFAAACTLAWLWFLGAPRWLAHNRPPETHP